MIFVFYFHYDIGITTLLFAYPTEIFPYALRGWGVSLTYMSTQFGLILALFVNPIAMKAIGWKYYILFCVLNAVFFSVIFFVYPETKGHSLEEITRVFEGTEAGFTVKGSAAIRKRDEESIVVEKEFK